MFFLRGNCRRKWGEPEMLDTKTRSTHPKTTRRQRTLAKGKPLQIKCPYCGRYMQLRSADGIYKDNKEGKKLYVCSNYPECDTYVRLIDGTLEPMGTPANGHLRRLRDDTHKMFDQIWRTGLMSRQDAYSWMAMICGIPEQDAHIGNFREVMCNKVMESSSQLLSAKRA